MTLLLKAESRRRRASVGRPADRSLKEVRDDVLRALRSLRSRQRLEEIARAAERGRVADVERLLDIRPGEAGAAMDDLRRHLREAFAAGALAAAGALPRVARVEVRFDLLNPRSIQFLRGYDLALIQGIDSATREGVRGLLLEAFREGVPPDELSRRIKDIVGLTERQAMAVDRHRDLLEDEGLRGRKLDAAVDAYAERQLAARSLNIARTETIRAEVAGQRELWRQAVDQGLVPRDASMVWVVTDDDRLCPFCEQLDGKIVGLAGHERFTSRVEGAGGGRREFTAEQPPLHPQCRCAIKIAEEDLITGG